ncbi:MAG: SUMF1/EgtB/PvdO family nonheme iron enzyme [Planctomycetota bacterium]|jgi:formylglycine-generating enzyme required for sulfatase activity
MQEGKAMLTMVCLLVVGLCVAQTSQAQGPADSLGIEMVKIKAGTFTMGADLSPGCVIAEKGIFIQDELPARQVTITYKYEMSKNEVTNAQYEKYDPGHTALRGRAEGISQDDGEAVVYVNWYDAMGFCRWLSSRDTQYDYRLPTEAEWEYACRAGTRTPYNDGVQGDIYSMNPLGPLAKKWRIITEWVVTRGNRATKNISWGSPKDVDLKVGQEGPNAWGLCDMHGGVQEWCLDWYGPYVATDTVDPVGYANGSSKVVRGGCHNVHMQTLRSANRSSSNRTDKHFLLGFRVVRVPKGQSLPTPKRQQPVKRWAKDVSQSVHKWKSDSKAPYFELASLYDVKNEYNTPELAAQFNIPLYNHNHSPAITWARNGDLLLAWFTGESEKGQELTVPALRGRRQPSGGLVWDTEVSEFYKEADRNMHGTQLWNNAVRSANGFKEPFTLYLINGICTDGKWSKLAISFRKSTDNGVTWTEPVIIKQGTDAFHLDSDRNQPQGNAFTASDGALISFSDGSAIGGDGSSVNWSNDGGKTWSVRTVKDGPPGNHVGGVELLDGRIMTFSRDKGRTFGSLPKSISNDQGKTWTFSKTEFPGIGTVQRLALLRLEYSDPGLDPDGLGRKPILLISMASDGMKGKDANGNDATIYGTYAALSWDEGETWPVKRVMSNVKSGSKSYVMGPWNKTFNLDATHGQNKSYWAATQTPDGIVHLTDSRLVYAFNLAWLISVL